MSHEAESTELLPFSNSIPFIPLEQQRSLASGDESLNTNAHYADKDVSQISPKHSPSTDFRRWAVKWWLWELLACLLSLLSLVAIILFLQYYDGRAQPDWVSYITLNSVLSWFAVLVQSSMVSPPKSGTG